MSSEPLLESSFSLDTIAFQLNECSWERSEDVEVRSVYKAMSRNRYVEIKRYFHLANNEELDANREEKGQSFVQPD